MGYLTMTYQGVKKSRGNNVYILIVTAYGLSVRSDHPRSPVDSRSFTHRRNTFTMGLSIEELELQSSECLPAREVMTMVGGGGNHNGHCHFAHTNEQSGAGLIPLNLNLEDVQVGLVNVNVDNVCIADVLNDNSILNNVLSGNGAGNTVTSE
jgi:hypothetical protein